MLPDPLNVPDDLLLLAQAAVDANVQLAACVDAVFAAQERTNEVSESYRQALTDLANAIGAAGILMPAFQHGGYIFTPVNGELKMSPVPPDLSTLGGTP